MSCGETGTAWFDPEDAAPFEVQKLRSGAHSIVVICDHAGNALPRRLATLGLAARRLDEHIAYDIGAGGVARHLAIELEAAFVLGRYSRLAADLNRSPHDSSVVPAISDGVLVPGNLGLTVRERAARIEALHAPYHRQIERMLAEQVAAGSLPVVIAIHSFTPSISSIPRPWHVGVLWDKDGRLAIPLLAALRAEGDLIVGDNEPYSGRHPADFSIDHHAEGGGFAHAAIEIRQDLIATPTEQSDWAVRLGRILRPLLEDRRLYARLGIESAGLP